MHLSPLLWAFLLLLAEAAPNPVTRAELTRRLWGDQPPSSDTLRAHAHLLRQVLDKPFETALLETVHGIGFRLRSGE